MQRKWRRAWKRGKPSFMIYRKPPKTVQHRGRKAVPAAFRRLVPPAVAASLLLSAGLVWASPPIVTDGKTQTTVATAGNVTDITTATVRGANAFNSFSVFNVPTGQIVNLQLPNGTHNLLNLVHNETSYINGIMNSFKNGQIGGNVYFLNPYGVVVGSGASINVGSLAVITPPKSFMDGFFTSPGNPSAAATQAVLDGNVPVSASGFITVKGKVNVQKDVRLAAGTVANAGEITTGAVFVAKQVDFGDVVNVNGYQSGARIAAENGNIEIVAVGNVENSGVIAADGANGLKAGNVTIKAGGDVTLAEGSVVSARGRGENSAGGTVYIYGQNNATLTKGAITASGGETSGDGGFVEFSAKNKVTIAGGSLVAGATSGKAGTVYIDPTDIDWKAAASDVFKADGTSYTLSGDTITLEDVVISTRKVAAADANRTSIDTAASTGDSGSITLTAPVITLKSGTKLLAHAVNDGGTTYSGGDITLTATKESKVGAKTETKIDIDGAVLKGKNITAAATATSDYNWLGLDASLPTKTAIEALSGTVFAVTGLDVGVATAEGKAEVLVRNNAVIDASGDVSLTADTTAGATTLAAGIGSFSANKYFNVGFVYGKTTATATVDVQSGTIGAANLKVAAANNADLNINVIGFSTKDKANVAVAVGAANVESTAQLGKDATINATKSVTVTALNNNSFSTNATAMALDQGQVGATAAVFEGTTKATATNNANLTTAGLQKVTVNALDETTKNRTAASSSTGTSTIAQYLITPELHGLDKLGDAVLAKMSYGSQQLDAAAGGGKPKLAAAVSYTDFSATAKAAVGDNATINASGDIVVAAKVSDALIQTHASSSVDGLAKNPDAPASNMSLSAAIAVGKYSHDSSAVIGRKADITGANIGVRSDVALPYQQTYTQFESLSDVIGHLNSNLGLANGFLTGYANATSDTQANPDGSGGLGLNGAVSYMDFTSKSKALVDKEASLKTTGTASGAWKSLTSAGTAPTLYNIDWAAPVDITSKIDVQGVFAAGNVSLTFSGAGGEGAKAVGGSYGQVNYASTNYAYVAEGASIGPAAGTTAQNVNVSADTSTRVFMLAPTAGRGTTIGVNALFSVANINDKTLASIDDEARIGSGAVTVKAQGTIDAMTIAGALNTDHGAGVGATVAMNSVTTDTESYIGDNDQLNGDGSTLALTTGKVAAGAADINARTDGRVEAIGFAATVSSANGPSEGTGKLAKAQGSIGDFFLGKGVPADQQPKFGLAVSGSSAINETNLTTKAYISSAATVPAAVALDPARGTTALNIGAVNSTDITAATGTAAIVRSGKNAKWSAAIAGSVSLNNIDNTTEAYIQNATVTDAKDVSVTALTGGEQLAVAIGAEVNASADQEKAGSAAGSVSVSLAKNKTSARIEDSHVSGNVASMGTLAVASYDKLKIGTGGGSLVAGGAGGFGAAVSYAEIANTTEALVRNSVLAKVATPPTASYNNIFIKAETAAKIASGAGMAGITTAKDNLGTIGGAFVFNDIGNTVQAKVTGSSTVKASGTVDILAKDTTGEAAFDSIINSKGTSQATALIDYSDSKGEIGLGTPAGSSIFGVAGLVQYGKNNIGVSVVDNKIHNTYTAAIADSDAAAGTVSVRSQASTLIQGYAVGVGVAGKGGSLAGAGSVTVNETNNTTEAYIDNTAAGQTVTAATLDVKAEDSSGIDSFSGQVTVAANNASIGAATADSQINNTTKASITGADFDVSSAATVAAANTSRLRTLAVSGGGAKEFAFNGSVATSNISNTTEAKIDRAKAGNTLGAVTVQAEDNPTIEALSGSAAFSGKAAVGAAVAINRISDTTKAHVSGTATGGKYDIKDLLVKSVSQPTVKNLAVGVGGGFEVGVAGSVVVNLITSTNSAYIDNGARITARNNAAVIARTDEAISNSSGSLGIGLGTAGIGLTVTVNEIGGTTEAYIAGSDTQVAALASDSTQSVTIAAGGLTSPINLDNGVDIEHYGRTDLKSKLATETVHGVAVNAAASHSIENIAANVAGGYYAGVGATVSVNHIGGKTQSYIDGAKINADTDATANPSLQALSVKAADHAYSNGFVGTVAAGAAGFGVATDVNTFERTTTAKVVNSGEVRAKGPTTIAATSSQGASSLAVGGAGGAAAVAGTGSVAKFKSTTEAYMENSTAYGGDLGISASHGSNFTVKAGGVTVGGVAFAGTFAVATDESTTTASLKASTVNNSGAIDVGADNAATIANWGASGAGGGVGIAGSAVVSLAHSTTKATVEKSTIGSAASRAASLSVHAIDKTTVTNRAGVVSAGVGGALGASASVVKTDNTVAALVDSSSVYLTGAATVDAQGERNIDNKAVTAGVGASVGIGGTVVVTVVGQNVSGDAAGELDKGDSGTLSEVNKVANGDHLASALAGRGLTANEIANLNDKTKTDVKTALRTADLTGKTSAQVDTTTAASTIDAGGNIKISASEKDKAVSLAGSIGAGAVGVGGAVAVQNITNNIEARTLGSVSLSSAGDNIDIAAAAARLNASDVASFVQAYQGSAGVVSLGAAVADAKLTNNVTASAGRGATLTAGGAGKQITITAADSMDVDAEAQGYTAGAAAIGVVVATADKEGASQALAGDSAASGNAMTVNGALSLSAARSGKVYAFTRAGAGGVYSGSGSGATATDNGASKAKLGNNVTVNAAAQAVRVAATAKPQVEAKAAGYQGSLLGSAGGAVALANATTTVEATLGSGAAVTAGSLTLNAAADLDNSNPTAKSYAEVVGIGGLLGVNATVSEANSTSTVTTAVGTGSVLTVSGNTGLTATNNTSQQAEVSGIVGGLAAAGANIARATADSTTDAYLGESVRLNMDAAGNPLAGGIVSISAQGTDSNEAKAKAGSGGVIAGAAAVAYTNAKNNMDAYIGDSAKVGASNISINATHAANFNGTVDSRDASVLGASGAVADHTVTSTVNANIGKTAVVSATGDILLHAGNTTAKQWLNGATNADDAEWNVSAAGGGVLHGEAIKSTANATNTSNVGIGDGARITAGTANTDAPGSFAANADSDMTLHDKSRINTGGAIAAAVIDSTVSATSTNAVSIGANASIVNPYGDIKAGSKSSADLDNRAAVDVYGVAGLPAGKAHSNYTGSNTLTVAAGAKLETYHRDIRLGAGQDTTGAAGVIKANGTVNLWNHTPALILKSPDAQANVQNDATATLAGTASSARDIYIAADRGDITTSYSGVGKNLATEVLHLIGVSVEVHGGSRSQGGTAGVVIDGTAETGTKRKQHLTIGGNYVDDASGTSKVWVADLSDKTDDVTYTHTNESISQGMTDRLNELYKLRAQYLGDATATGAYDAEILFLQNKMVSMGLANWNGDVFVPGSGQGTGQLSPYAAAVAARDSLQVGKTRLDTIKPVDDLIVKRDADQAALTTRNGELTAAKNALPAGKPVPTDAADAKAKGDAESDPTVKAQYYAIETAYQNVTTAETNLAGDKAAIAGKGYDANIAEATYLDPYGLADSKDLNDSLAAVESRLSFYSDAYLATLSHDPPAGPTADFITVKPVTALLGNINIKADNLTGKGTLNAPGDAEITITNNSPNFLKIGDLEVRNGGSILFNGAAVKTKADINALNASKSGADFAAVHTKHDTALPAITITSNYKPDDYKVELHDEAHQGTGVWVDLAPAPDITLTGNVSNIYGPVTVRSEHGSIYANGTITAGTVDVLAKNGDFVQSYVNGFDHIGGDPSTIYGGTTTPKGITANGNVFISARYLNINGLIQSGIADWTLTLAATPTFTATPAQLGLDGITHDVTNAYGTATYNDKAKLFEISLAYAEAYQASGDGQSKNPGGMYNVKLTGTDNLGAAYDTAKKQYVIDGTEVHGGHVQLYGQILNTAKDGAATGKVRALDGYGTINITNNTGRDIVITKLDTGNGTAGVIDITDVQDTDGHKIRTVYTSDRGEVTKVTTGRWNGATFDDSYTATEHSSPTTSGGRVTTTYNPQAGLYYTWTTGQDKSQTESYYYESSSVFGFKYSGHTVGSLTGVTYGETYNLDDGTYLTKGYRPHAGESGYTIDAANYHSAITQTIKNGQEQYTKLDEWTTRHWYTLWVHATYHLKYKIVRPLKDITTNTVTASNPIGIEFFGNNSGAVNVAGNSGNVLLNGAINNKDGSTVLTSSKDIKQLSDSALITTKTLDLVANNVGTADAPVRAVVGGTFNAAAQTGNVNFTQVLGNLALGTVKAETGTLAITADGSIANAANYQWYNPGTGAFETKATSEVRGLRIELTSANGAIGGLTAPLTVFTGATTSTSDADRIKYGLKASALGDIGITNQAWSAGGNAGGDLLVDTVVSKAGDVKLTAPGMIVDNNIDEHIDTRSWAQLTGYWDSLQLREGTAANDAKREQTITSYNNGKTADYRSYWQMQSRMSDGQYKCSDGERAALIAQGKDVAAFEAEQTAKYNKLAGEGVGAWNGGVYSASFVYSASDTEKAQLLSGAGWTEKELAVSVLPTGLKQLTDTNTVVKDPNVKGRNVTLAAGAGIGSDLALAGIDVSNPAALTPQQKVALAAAEREDLTVVGNIAYVTQRRPVYVETADGLLAATAGTNAYLAADKSLAIDKVTAGGNVRVKVNGSITGGATAAITGQNLILEAAAGNIGSSALSFEPGNTGTLTARASGDIYITKTGDISVDSVYTPGDIYLVAGGDILSAYADPLDVMGKNITLTAGGQTGTSAKAFGVSLTGGLLSVATQGDSYLYNVSGDLSVKEVRAAAGSVRLGSQGSLLNGNSDETAVAVTGDNVELTAATGTIGKSDKRLTASVAGRLTASAKGDINAKIAGDLHADSLTSTDGAISLTTPAGAIDLTTATAAAGITLAASEDITAGTLTSTGGSIGLTTLGGTISLTTATAANGELKLDAAGDIALGSVRSATQDFLVRNPGGRLSAGTLTVGTSGTYRADYISLPNVVHDGVAPLSVQAFGGSKSMADNVDFSATTAAGVTFNQLTANLSTIHVGHQNLKLYNVTVGARANISNSNTTVVAALDTRTLLPVDVQLYPDKTFWLTFDAPDIVRTNAKVIKHSSDFDVNDNDEGSDMVDLAADLAAMTGQPPKLGLTPVPPVIGTAPPPGEPLVSTQGLNPPGQDAMTINSTVSPDGQEEQYIE